MTYDAAMKERERQQREKEASRIAETKAKLETGKKHDWRNPGGENKEVDGEADSEVSKRLESHKVTDPIEDFANSKKNQKKSWLSTEDFGDLFMERFGDSSENKKKVIDGQTFYNDYAMQMYFDSKKRYIIENGSRQNPLFSKFSSETAQKVADENFKKHIGADITLHNVINGHKTVEATSPYFKYSLLTKDEKDTYNYLASFTEPKKVLEYLNLIDNDLEQRKAHEVAKKIDATGSTNLKTLAVATSSFASGLESIGKASMRLNGGSSPMMNRIAYNPSYGKMLSSALIENEDSAVRKLILNVVSTVSNQAPALAYGLYTGGAGYGFALGNQVTSDSIAEAVQNNKTIESGFVYGLAQTALELSLEKLFGGIASKISGKGTSSFVSKMMNKIDDVVGNKKVASLIKKTLSLSETGAGEFLQEFTQAMTDPMLRNIIYNENNTYSAETLTDALYQGLIGFFAGGVMAAPTVKASVSNVQYTKIGEMSNAKNVLKLCEDVGYRHSDSYAEVKNSVEKGKTVDNATLGRLSVEVTQAIYDNTHFTEEYMATVANLGTTEQIAELMFGGNTEAAVKFKEKYSSRSVVDEGLSREYNNEVSIDENNRGGTYESVETDLAEWGQGGHTGERTGTLQENLGRNNDQGRATRIEQGGSPGIRSGERGGNRKLTSEQSEGLKTTAIKNEDGTPKIVYHFTDNMEFDVFAKGDIGFHFGNETQATARGSIQNKNGRTITAYLDIKNPLNISTDIMSWRPRNLALKLLSDGTISVEQYRNILKMDSDDAYSYDDPAAIELRRILAEKGYDGIVYQNMFEGDGESYIAFYPEQVIIINDGKGDGPSSSPTSQVENGESVFNISARGDRKDAVTRSIEKVTGHYSLNEHQKLLYEVGAQFGAKVRFANLDYVVEKEVKVRGADGRMQTVVKRITVSPEGQFDPDTNTITLNTNVKPYHRPVEYILKHEMTHSLEVDPESYNLFAKEVLGSEEFLRYAASKINPETEEAFGSADAWMQYIIKSYADKGASLGEGTEAQYKAKCEMVANFVGDMLFGGRGNISAGLMAEISTEAKTGLLGWIQRFFEKVKQIFKGRPELTEIERLEQEFLKAARSVSNRNQKPAENEKATTEKGDGVKYSIATDSEGKYVKVDTNQNIFDGKSVREMQEIARKLIRDNFRGKVLNVGEEGKAFVSKRSSDEYSYPANRRMNESLKESKMKAAPELDNLLSVSRFIEHQSDDGRHPQATGGWDVYSTRFEVGGTMFSGEVKIMVTDRGYLFHDITKIKRLPVNGGLTETSSAAASGNPSIDSITENGTPVNSNSMQQGVKYSLSDVNVEKLTESQYNNFGWVRANDVLSAAEYNSLMSNYTGHKHNGDYFPITRFGETVLHSSQHNDVLMYAKGSIKSPQITKVVRILADDANIKEVILRYERENNYRTFQIVRNYFGEWVLNIDYRKDYDNYREYRAEQKRKSGQSSDTSGGTEQNRGRGFAEDSSAGRGNVKYSLSSFDHASLLDDYDTHYGEYIHHTPSDYKPTSNREWQVFCRSFANQTNSMKEGEYRAISIFTADAHYLISADGYMSGVIVDKVGIDEYEERKEFYDNIPGADVSNFGNEENGSGQRNYSNSDVTSQNEGTDSFDVELDAFIESHPEWFANKRKTRPNHSDRKNVRYSIPVPYKIEDIFVCHGDGSLDNFFTL